MSMDQIVCLFLALGVFVGYFAGKLRGEIKQRDLWRPHMEKSSRYMRAVDDLDKWCGRGSPHVRLIARHIRAHGEGEGCNSGTPVGDEPCTISGLREQLKRLSQEARVPLSDEQIDRGIAELGLNYLADAHVTNRSVLRKLCRHVYGITAAQKEASNAG